MRVPERSARHAERRRKDDRKDDEALPRTSSIRIIGCALHAPAGLRADHDRRGRDHVDPRHRATSSEAGQLRGRCTTRSRPGVRLGGGRVPGAVLCDLPRCDTFLESLIFDFEIPRLTRLLETHAVA